MNVVTRAGIVLVTVMLIGTVSGCAAAPVGAPPPAPASSEASPADSATCAEVAVVVNFGPLDAPPITACVAAGTAADVLALAGVTTEGTLDYGDQVVCRVNERPSPSEEVVIEGQEPFVESCATLNAAAYWALWVKTSSGSDWEYAQEGAATLELADGQAVGLVYTAGTDSVPPEG